MAQLFSLGHMTISTVGKSSLKISYGIFFVVLVALFSLLGFYFTRSRYAPNPAPFGVLFSIALVWQVFTLYFYRRHFLTWILTVLYAIPAVMLLIYVLRSVA